LSIEPRRFRIDLAYDGTDFCGWQVQARGRTVQGLLEQTLARLQGGAPVAVRGAGRTDAGVHARQQVADVRLTTPLGDAELGHSLRSMLPGDLRPLRVREVEDSFHSRRDARSKTYRYRLDRSRGGDPFLARYALHRAGRLDLEAMREALNRLPGRRDWSGFAASACEVRDRVREMTEARYEETAGGEGWFSFTADGFLTHMVRNLVGTLLDVGRGRFDPGRIERILAAGDRSLAGPTAAARGLVLWRVVYPGDTDGDV
jgi:tRNA pseudouridine38-40 synthase